MRSNKTKQWLSAVIVLCALIISLITAGCAEQVGTEDECLRDLDDQNFSSVADNPDCSNYDRASAHMGLAGFLFSNFVRKNASDNFRLSLDIPDWEKNWENTPRQRHYQEARRLTGDSTDDYYYLQARPKADTEIHLFASLASIISEAYIKFDVTPDGKITEDEINNFTQMVSEEDVTVDIIVDLVLFERDMPGDGTDNKIPFLIEIKQNDYAKCVKHDATYDYAGVFLDNQAKSDFVDCGIITLQELNAASGFLNISGNCSVIAKVNELKFFEGNSLAKVPLITNLGTNFFGVINGVNKDLDALDISPNSELRKNLNDFTKDIDNGGQCVTSSKKTLDRALGIIDKVSRYPQSSYKDRFIYFNDLTSDVKKADIPLYWSTEIHSSITLNFGCDESSDLNMLKARVTFLGKRGQYLPYYGECEPSNDYCCYAQDQQCGAKQTIQNSLATLSDITKDMVTDSSADDGKLSISEIVCFDNSADSQ